MKKTVSFEDYLIMKNSLNNEDLDYVFEKAWNLTAECKAYKRKKRLLAVGGVSVVTMCLGVIGYSLLLNNVVHPVADIIKGGLDMDMLRDGLTSTPAIAEPLPKTPQYIYDYVNDTVDFFNGNKFYRV